MIIFTLECGWGRTHRKFRGIIVRGGDETRLTTGTIFTDKLFTGQREMRCSDCAKFYPSLTAIDLGLKSNSITIELVKRT